jgi:purine-binding chemotaxis protein CheW
MNVATDQGASSPTRSAAPASASNPSAGAPGRSFGQPRKSAAKTEVIYREVLTFRLGREEYAIDILRVQEIRGFEEPLHIAGTPAFIKGVINLRGVIVPILDLRLKFGLAEANFDSTTVAVILNIGERVIGVVVDSVNDVIEIPSHQIKALPAFSGAVDARYITGMATLGEGETQRMLIMLDAQALIGEDGLM